MCSSIPGTHQRSSKSDNNGDGGGRGRGSGGGTDNASTNGNVRSGISSDSSLLASSTTSNPIIVKFKNAISKRRRTIYVVYFIAFLDLFAVSLFLPLLNLEIIELGSSAFMTGLIASTYGAIQLISSPIMGLGSDNYGQKPVLFGCLLATAFAYVIQGAAINLALMLTARVIAGIFKHTQTIGKSIISELSPKDKSHAIGNFNAFGSIGFILGPTLGAYIMLLDNGFRIICFISAASFVLNAVLVLFLIPSNPSRLSSAPDEPLPDAQPSDESDKKNDEEVGLPTRTAIKKADVHSILLLVVRFLFSFATLVFRETLSYVLKVEYGTEVVDRGHLTSLQALMSTIIGFAVGPVNTFVYKGNSLYMVLISGILKTIALATLFWSSNYIVAVTMLLTISCLNPFLRVGVTALSLEGHQHEVGTILGLSQSSTSLARMISPAVAGFAVTFSNDGPFLVAGISALLGTFATIIAQRYKAKKAETGKAKDDHHDDKKEEPKQSKKELAKQSSKKAKKLKKDHAKQE